MTYPKDSEAVRAVKQALFNHSYELHRDHTLFSCPEITDALAALIADVEAYTLADHLRRIADGCSGPGGSSDE